MKNNKGFTMIELLACIIIISILIGVSVGAVYKHIEKSKQKSYDNLETSLYDAARNYVMDNNISLPKCVKNGSNKTVSGYKLLDNNANKELVSKQYINNIIDPGNKKKECSYQIYACKVSNETGMALSSYEYKVHLKGTKYDKTYVHDDDGTKKEEN